MIEPSSWKVVPESQALTIVSGVAPDQWKVTCEAHGDDDVALYVEPISTPEGFAHFYFLAYRDGLTGTLINVHLMTQPKGIPLERQDEFTESEAGEYRGDAVRAAFEEVVRSIDALRRTTERSWDAGVGLSPAE